MEFYETATKSGVELENQVDDKKILVLSRHLNRRCSPTTIAQGGLSKADIIRGVARNMTMNALDVLDKMRDDCQKSPDLKENYYQLYRYLDYLKRFCEETA